MAENSSETHTEHPHASEVYSGVKPAEQSHYSRPSSSVILYIFGIALISLALWLFLSDSKFVRGMGVFYTGIFVFLVLIYRCGEVFRFLESSAHKAVAALLNLRPVRLILFLLTTYQYTVAVLLGLGFFVLSYWTGPNSTFYASVGVVIGLYGIFSMYRHPAQGHVPPPETLSRLTNRVAIFLGVGCVFFFFVFLYRYGLNIPYFDEFYSTLPLIATFWDLTMAEKYEMLISQHITHRILTARVVYLLVDGLMGHTDHRAFMFVGFGILCMFSWLLYQLSARRANRLAAFVPVIFLLFQIQYHETSLSGSMLIHHILFAFFVASTMYFIAKRSYLSFSFAILSGVASVFSLAGGIFVPIVVLAYLVYEKRITHALIWLLSMTPVLLIFFSELVTRDSPFTRNYGTPTEAIARMLMNIIGSSSAMGYLTDMEGHGPYYLWRHAPMDMMIPAVLASTFAIGIMAVLTLKRYFDRNAPIYLFVLILFMNLASVSLMRHQVGACAAFFSRYTLYSALIFAGLYMAICDQWPAFGKRHLPIMIVLALMFNAFSYNTTIPYVKAHNGNILYGLFEATVRIEHDVRGRYVPNPLFNIGQLSRSIRGGHYRVPYDLMESRLASSEVSEVPIGKYSEANIFRMVSFSDNKHFYRIQIGFDENSRRRNFSEIYMVFETEKGAHTFKVKGLLDTPANKRVMEAIYGTDTRWLAVIPKEAIQGDTFQLSVYGTSESGGVHTLLGEGPGA